MLPIIIYFLSSALAQTNASEHATILHIVDKEVKRLELAQNQTMRISTYNDSKTTIALNISMEGNNKHICQSYDRQIIVDDFFNKHQPLIGKTSPYGEVDTESLKFTRDEDYNDPNYFLLNPIIVSMVRTLYGFVILTSNHYLYLIELSQTNTTIGFTVHEKLKIDFNYLRSGVIESEVAKLLYEPYSHILYIVYKSQVIMGRMTESEIVLNNANIIVTTEQNYIGNAMIHRRHMFVAVGQEGLDQYRIENNGDLTFISNYKTGNSNMMVVDVVFGGMDERWALVLDKLNGVEIFQIETDGGINIRLGQKLWSIRLIGGYVIKANERVLMVMVENVSQNLVVEYALYLEKSRWFFMKNHYLNGKYFNIELSEQYAIVSAVNAHRIIYHSVWHGFEPDQDQPITWESWYDPQTPYRDDEFIIIPKLQSLKMYGQLYQQLNDKGGFNLVNNTYPFIVAVTTHQIAVLQTIDEDPYIECTIPKNVGKGDTFNMNVTLNSTWCHEKFVRVINGTTEFPNLIMCMKEEQIQLMVMENITEEKDDRQVYVVVIAIGTITIAFLLCQLRGCYLKNKRRRAEQLVDIQRLDARGYTVDDQSVNDVSISGL